MLLHLHIAARHLQRHLSLTLINTMGLGLGMACVILVWLHVDDQYSFDRFRANADRTYRVISRFPDRFGNLAYNQDAPGALADTVLDEIPEIEAAVRVRIGHRWTEYGETARRIAFWHADPNVLEFFDLALVDGDIRTALSLPNSVVINEDAVSHYFGRDDPIGKTIVGHDREYVVSGVLASLPPNSAIQVEFLTGTAPVRNLRNGSWHEWSGARDNHLQVWVRLRDGADPAAVERKLSGLASAYLPQDRKDATTFHLQTFLGMHLFSRAEIGETIHGPGAGMPAGDLRYLQTLSFIALAILAIACINFTNLATARVSTRAREVGVRKAIGAVSGELTRQFLVESILLALLALPVALILVAALLPAWSGLIGQSFPLDPFGRPLLVLFLTGLTLSVGALAGLYPAFVLSRFDPIHVLHAQRLAKSRGALRHVLVVIQFATSIALVVGTFVAASQSDYAHGKDLGFDRDNVIALRFFDSQRGLRERYHEIKSALLARPNVLAATASASLPGEGWTRSRLPFESPDRPGVQWSMSNYAVDEDWFDFIDVDMVAGRSFSLDHPTDATRAFILNETAVRALGLQDPIGTPFRWGERAGFVIGVVRDHHTRDLYEAIDPTVFTFEPRRFRVVNVRYRPGDVRSTVSGLEQVWKRFVPVKPLYASFLDDRLEREYRRDERFRKICSLAFAVVVLVACMGLYALSAFIAERRTREIGIRKVVGATTRDIVVLLSREFALLVLLANVLAFPVAYLYMESWLARYAYRIDQGILPYLGALSLSLLLAMGTVAWQARKAAHTDPVAALRIE